MPSRVCTCSESDSICGITRLFLLCATGRSVNSLTVHYMILSLGHNHYVVLFYYYFLSEGLGPFNSDSEGRLSRFMLRFCNLHYRCAILSPGRKLPSSSMSEAAAVGLSGPGAVVLEKSMSSRNFLSLVNVLHLRCTGGAALRNMLRLTHTHTHVSHHSAADAVLHVNAKSTGEN